MIGFGVAKTDADLRQILALQASNLPTNISGDEAKEQGFVTVQHDFDLLKKMNSPHPHIVVRDGGAIVGYALVMLKSFRDEIPVLVPMFERINKLEYGGVNLVQANYFIMGQICISKPYRGMGLFERLYAEMKRRMAGHFDYIITEVASRNVRSIGAHQKVGFETILEYQDQEFWQLMILDMKLKGQ